MSSGVVRSTALRAGGACVRCRKGKTKCVYENGRAPCKNCAKGMHECYLPSETMAHHHGQSPARHASAHRPPRDSLPASGAAGAAETRQAVVGSGAARHVQANSEKYVTKSTHILFPLLGPITSLFFLFLFSVIPPITPVCQPQTPDLHLSAPPSSSPSSSSRPHHWHSFPISMHILDMDRALSSLTPDARARCGHFPLPPVTDLAPGL